MLGLIRTIGMLGLLGGACIVAWKMGRAADHVAEKEEKKNAEERRKRDDEIEVRAKARAMVEMAKEGRKWDGEAIYPDRKDDKYGDDGQEDPKAHKKHSSRRSY